MRFAVVSLGSAGRRHALLLRDLRPEAQIVAVRSGYGTLPEEGLVDAVVPTAADAIAMGLDGAVIASPAPAHVDQALEFAAAGVGLLVEKPLSESARTAQRLTSTDVPLLVGYVLAHTASGALFADALSDGDIGEILGADVTVASYLPNWRGTDYRSSVAARRALGGGVLLELSHEIEYARRLFGPFHTVQAELTNSGTLDIDVEDRASLTLVGTTEVSVQLDFASRSVRRCCVVRTTRGSLTWDLLDTSVTWEPADGAGWRRRIAGDWDDMYRRQLEHWFAVLQRKERPLVTVDDAIATLTIIDAARLSATSGRTAAVR